MNVEEISARGAFCSKVTFAWRTPASSPGNIETGPLIDYYPELRHNPVMVPPEIKVKPVVGSYYQSELIFRVSLAQHAKRVR